MNKQLTEMVLILDRSGSMHGLEADTIGGFNSTIEKQKKVDGKAFVTTVLFDDVSEVIHDRVDLQKVKPITSNEYFVRGCTALLDAVGSTINHIKGIHKYARPEDVPAHTVVVITTDGYGASDGARTHGLPLKGRLLYQLSYWRINGTPGRT